MTSLIQLEYIVAIDTYRHFVTASEKCFVTQPTLSMQIKKLEESLGVIIFDRTKQPISPTEIGEKIINQARKILSETNKIDEIINEYNNIINGELTIGIIPSIAPFLLPSLIKNFTKRYPEVHLKVKEMITEEIEIALKKETIDVGILVTPLQDKQIYEEPLFYEEILLYTNKSHPISTESPIKATSLKSSDLWLLSNGHCFRSQVINLCNIQNEQKKNSQFEYESSSLETIKKIVEHEGGFTLLPELAVGSQVPKNINVKQFDDKTPLREVSLVYTRNYTKKRLLNILAEEITNTVPKKLLNKNRGYIIEWK